ncbi:hypothetical protein SJ05684_c25220 [Sinorhizobium sojae CCBAU 05684]|uniref:Uncharacterized protein n=1 Tax=Sinorhizobium sojae CCBAU 05684 TaxID=716928 RepID=A0A249PDG2_9HYPH|nr:hypothetical protein [Sinorhizobium sojae]ASY63961.1 hypothetical protein SJ05684_c25220 [Sinorhizobium sojae CCBAU 05684]
MRQTVIMTGDHRLFAEAMADFRSAGTSSIVLRVPFDRRSPIDCGFHATFRYSAHGQGPWKFIEMAGAFQ